MEEEQVRALRFSGDFNFFALGWNHSRSTNNLSHYSISEGKLNKNFQKEIVTNIQGDQISDFQVVGDFVYSTTTNGSLLKTKIFNTHDNSNDSFQVVNTNSEIPSIATSDSRELLSFGCKNGKIFVFNTLQDSQIKSMSESSSINDILFQDKNILITASNKFVSLWDLRTPTSDVIKTQNKKNIEYSCICELNKTLIFAGSTSGHLCVFDQRKLLTPITQESPLHSLTIWDMKFHDNNLYSIGDDGFIVKTDFSLLSNSKDSSHITSNFEFLENISTPINAFDINSNSKILAYATEEETLNVLSI